MAVSVRLAARVLASIPVVASTAGIGSAQTFWGPCGGAFAPATNVVLDTSVNGGRFDFQSIHIPPGVEVSAVGPWPLRLFCAGDALIEGSLSADGAAGAGASVASSPFGFAGALGGAGGGRGGNGGNAGSNSQPGTGLWPGNFGGPSCLGFAAGGGGAGHGTMGQPGDRPPCIVPVEGAFPHGDPECSRTNGGGGGGGGGGGVASGGGGGGGAGGGIYLTVAGDLVVTGTISADGGDGGEGPDDAGGGGGGSGGTIVLRTHGSLSLEATAVLTATGGAASPDPPMNFGGAGGVGRIRFESSDGTVAALGTVDPAPSTGVAPAVVQGQLALGKPATASAFLPGSPPSMAFDGSYGYTNLWNSGGYPPHWIEVDLESPVAIGRIVLVPDVTPYVQASADYRIDASFDGTSLVTVWTYSGGATLWIPIVADFTAAPLEGVRKVRVWVLALTNSWAGLSEVEVHEPSGSGGFGCGCTGSSGSVPRLATVGGAPAIGNAAFGLRLSRIPGGTPCGLVLGFSNATYLGVLLPAALPGTPGCELFVAPNLVLATAVATGTGPADGEATISVPIPTDPNLAGLGAFFQAYAVDFGAGPLPIVVSNAQAVTLLP